jgi:hypothetical protein
MTPTPPPRSPVRDGADPAPGFFDPDRYTWPPDPVAVQVFVLAVLATGGPLTWWAVTR